MELANYEHIQTVHAAKTHLRAYGKRYQREGDLKRFWEHCTKLGISCRDGIWSQEEKG